MFPAATRCCLHRNAPARHERWYDAQIVVQSLKTSVRKIIKGERCAVRPTGPLCSCRRNAFRSYHSTVESELNGGCGPSSKDTT